MKEEYGKEVIRFGNWVVTSLGMYFDMPNNNYFINKNRLSEMGFDNRKEHWDWLVHLADKRWINELDLYQLNTAFFFAHSYFNCPYPEGVSTWKTLKEQKRLFLEDHNLETLSY